MCGDGISLSSLVGSVSVSLEKLTEIEEEVEAINQKDDQERPDLKEMLKLSSIGNLLSKDTSASMGLGLGNYVSELEEDQGDYSDDCFETDVSGNWLTVEKSLPHAVCTCGAY